MLFAVVVLAISGGRSPTRGAPVDPPVPVTVQDLLEAPERYDGKRVVVAGLVRSIEFQRGRRGSEYLKLVIEDPALDQPAIRAITVISFTFPPVKTCDQAVVRGVYHHEGKQGGQPYDDFIDAETIIPESLPGPGGGPSGGDCRKKTSLSMGINVGNNPSDQTSGPG